jgi:hypothetical protein
VYRKLGDPPAQAVVYELEQLDTLDSPEYGRVRERTDGDTRPRLAALSDFVRAAGTLIAEGGKADIAAPVLLALWFNVPAERLEEFDDWYINEHGPLILQVERWRRWRLFDISTSNGDITRLVLHDLDSPGSSERLRADRRWQTPRFRELQKYDWFRDVASHEYVRTA